MNTSGLDPHLEEKVQQAAANKDITVSDTHQEALDASCAADMEEPERSRYDDVIGVIDGPPDLAANIGRKYAEAMGEKHGRRTG